MLLGVFSHELFIIAIEVACLLPCDLWPLSDFTSFGNQPPCSTFNCLYFLSYSAVCWRRPQTGRQMSDPSHSVIYSPSASQLKNKSRLSPQSSISSVPHNFSTIWDAHTHTHAQYHHTHTHAVSSHTHTSPGAAAEPEEEKRGWKNLAPSLKAAFKLLVKYSRCLLVRLLNSSPLCPSLSACVSVFLAMVCQQSPL